MGFIVFALFFYLIYFLVKYLFIKPFKQGYAMNGRRSAYDSRRPFQPQHREGDVIITHNPAKGRKEATPIGEYVDYEEVKD